MLALNRATTSALLYTRCMLFLCDWLHPLTQQMLRTCHGIECRVFVSAHAIVYIRLPLGMHEVVVNDKLLAWLGQDEGVLLMTARYPRMRIQER